MNPPTGTPAGATTESSAQIAYAATVLGGTGRSRQSTAMVSAFCKRMPSRVWPTCAMVCRTRSCCLKVLVVPGCGTGPAAGWSRSRTRTATSAASGDIAHDPARACQWWWLVASCQRYHAGRLGYDGHQFPGVLHQPHQWCQLRRWHMDQCQRAGLYFGRWLRCQPKPLWHSAITISPVALRRSATAYTGPGSGLLNIFNAIDPSTGTTAVNGSGQPFSFHPGGVHVALGDGSVKFISENIPIRLFARLVTRDQNEPVDGSFYESYQAH